jgi:hypothetical protein
MRAEAPRAGRGPAGVRWWGLLAARALATCLVLLLAGLPIPAVASDDTAPRGGVLLRGKKKRQATSAGLSILLPLGAPERSAEEVSAGELMEMEPRARRDFLQQEAPGVPLPENFGTEEQEQAQEELSRQYHQGMADTLKVMSQAAGTSMAGLPPKLKPGQLATRGSARGFGTLAHAAEFGILPYNRLRRLLEGTGLRAHHLIEKRFSAVMEQNPSHMLAIAVTPEEHQAFTNAWRAAIPYRVGAGTDIDNVTREQVLKEARKVYAKYPTILRALGLK